MHTKGETMLKLRLAQGSLLKKIVASIKDLVTNANLDCSDTGLSLQAMDSSNAVFVALLLRAEGFEQYKCGKNVSLGINFDHMAMLLKRAANNDTITIKADDRGDTVTFLFEDPCNKHNIADYEMTLMDIDSEQMEIPDMEYQATVRMPSSEFAKICRDLSSIGDTVVISVTKDGIRFCTSGDVGTANILCRQKTAVDNPKEATIIEMNEPVSLMTFKLRYMNSFVKATSLSDTVLIGLLAEHPLVVEYKIPEMGHLRFYLAPKAEEDENE